MKPEMILLHGALGCAKQLNPLKTQLENDFRVHTFDFDGHGGTSASSPLTMDLFADNLSDYIRHNKLHKPQVFGYSMGGYAALKLAAKHPGQLGKIVTLGTKFNWSKAAAEKEARMLDPDQMEVKVPAFATSLANLHGEQLWKGLVSSTAQMMHDLAAESRLTDNDLQQIQNPVLVMVGEKDRMVTTEESKHTASLLPNGHLMQLPNVPHPIEKVDADLISGLVKTFIRK